MQPVAAGGVPQKPDHRLVVAGAGSGNSAGRVGCL